jgi:hypothetical protein
MSGKTFYQHATEQMKVIISTLLRLSKETHDFTSPTIKHWDDDKASTMLLTGKGLYVEQIPDREERENTWLARAAIPFNLEQAATGILYRELQPFTDDLIKTAFAETDDFINVRAEWIYDNPHLLPVLRHVAGTFSKRDLEKIIGQVSDMGISRPKSVKLAELLSSSKGTAIPNQSQISERMKRTTEGIVRDLVGRLLLEEFVASALTKARVPYKRENEYVALSGVVYDFRADFVVPEEMSPKAFIEVRKSSSGHASLYAKDKMFSAINWKGQHQDCLGVLIIDGPWTIASLEVLAKVFDYVVPLAKAGEMAEKIKAYLDGDRSVLRWLIQFRIERHTP